MIYLIPLKIALMAAFVFVLALAAGPAEGELQFNQAHHEYWGAALVLVGAWWGSGWVGWSTRAAFLLWPGVVLMVDDAVQHLIQRAVNQPTGRYSLVDKAFGWAYERWPWLRALTTWADGRLS